MTGEETYDSETDNNSSINDNVSIKNLTWSALTTSKISSLDVETILHPKSK